MHTDVLKNFMKTEQLELLKAIYIYSGINKEQIKKAADSLNLSEHDVHLIFAKALNQLEVDQSIRYEQPHGVTIH